MTSRPLIRVRMTAGSSIDYDTLTQTALRGVVCMVLNQVIAKGGLPGEHHFYIAFNTQAPDVVLSRRLKEKYPDEMMIVLQHRFWDLAVTEEGFEVKLTFDGIPERLYVPFAALRVFFDPSVRFTLQFGESSLIDDAGEGGGRRRGDGSARSGRGRNRNGRPRMEGVNEGPVPAGAPGPGAPPAAAPTQPTLFSPRPVPVQTQGPVAPASNEPQPKQNSGAKVFSLDQFRKK